jgi:hypothetical protein
VEIVAYAPEELAEIRRKVEMWLERAAASVWTFQVEQAEGLFWKDSDDKRAATGSESARMAERVSSTTTARCHLALAHADRLVAKLSEPRLENIRAVWSRLQLEANPTPNAEAGDTPRNWSLRIENRRDGHRKGDPLNNFEIAHLADLYFMKDYLDRFRSPSATNVNGLISAAEDGDKQMVAEEAPSGGEDTLGRLRQLVKAMRSELLLDKGHLSSAALEFDHGDEKSRHYFVTLHAARAHAIVEDVPWSEESDDWLRHWAVVESYCIEQCYYASKGPAVRRDTTQLLFAGAYYVLCHPQPTSDLIRAFINAIAQAQMLDGNWPATHPIIRKGRAPWYIISSELALSLTWLYFCPRVPDDCRGVLLQMMLRHFEGSVTESYLERDGPASTSGWADDHQVTAQRRVGWATAVVCHFLANFHCVLTHAINRSVIESLGLAENASRFLIGDFGKRQKCRWDAEKPAHRWFDLELFLWPRNADHVRSLSHAWTDPRRTLVNAPNTCEALSTRVLTPISRDPAGRPRRDGASGILSGPPGTRKTSLVRAIADSLMWPQVTIPASLILGDGWDMMEARSTTVFRRLKYLRGCVLFFDEFEEFFNKRTGAASKARRTNAASPVPEPGAPDGANKEGTGEQQGPSGTPAPVMPGGASRETSRDDGAPFDNRTMAAFMTSAMLPRLADLHDERWCLVFLATNFPDRLDEAATRPGRFDFELRIDHPGYERACEYIRDPGENLRRTLRCGEKYASTAEAVSAALEVFRTKRMADFAWIRTPENEPVEGAVAWGKTEFPFSLLESAIRAADKCLALGVNGSKALSDTANAALLHYAKTQGGETLQEKDLDELSPETKVALWRMFVLSPSRVPALEDVMLDD